MEPPGKCPMVAMAAILQNGRFDPKYVLPDDTNASLCSNEITLDTHICHNCIL